MVDATLASVGIVTQSSMPVVAEQDLSKVKAKGTGDAHILDYRALVHTICVGKEQTVLVDVILLTACVSQIDQPCLLELALGVHDVAHGAGRGDGGANKEGADAAVAESLDFRRKFASLAGDFSDVAEKCVTKDPLREGSAPDANLASQDNLVQRVLAEEDPVVEVEEPEADTGQGDEDESYLVLTNRHLLELNIFGATPLRRKEKVEDNKEAEIGSPGRVATRGAKAG